MRANSGSIRSNMPTNGVMSGGPKCEIRFKTIVSSVSVEVPASFGVRLVIFAHGMRLEEGVETLDAALEIDTS